MENHPQQSAQTAYPADIADAEYVSGLSTILVTTIQEAKDRISQIEYIFCSQLFPNFQNTAETLWKEKEKDLLLQMEKMQFEKQEILRETKLEDRVLLVMKKQESLELEVSKLQLELKNKSMEVEGGLELHNKLIQLAQSKTSSAAHKEKQLKEYEQKTDKLLGELETTRRTVDELNEELKEKTAAVEKGLKMQECLQSKVQLLDAEIMKNENLLNQDKYDKQRLMSNVKNLETDVYNLQKELRNKVDEGRKLHDQLRQQIDLCSLERSRTGKELEQLEKENKKVLAKLRESEEKIDGTELHGKLLHLIQAKESELLAEKKKRNDMIASYKSLKSQYNFLCARYVPRASGFAFKVIKQEDEQEVLDDDQGASLIPRINSISPPTSSAFVAPKIRANRPVSYWRDTRLHQSRVGPDPHDDFLDTSLENIRGNSAKVMKDEVWNHAKPNSKDKQIGNSDDETQDRNVDNDPKKQDMLPPTRSDATGFKYIEPVRKKAEQENLKRVECLQCKKFYDAVLPGEDKDSSSNRQNLRCEHHDEVSRHRYKYAPPLTPEGFWNIGFESEM
ncbi:unnamed protein product [Withania somnifera]